MEDKYKFQLWLAAFPFAFFCTLIFLGDGADAMSPRIWLF